MRQIQVNYLSRDFQTIKQDLIRYLRAYFPDQWQDFNVASPGMAMLELNAYVGDLLSYVADKKFNELFLDGVQERVSVYRLAKTKGYKVPGVRPAVTLVDIIIEVPATADGPDSSYMPLYRRGMQVKGAGQIFETINEIDFASDYSANGVANRTIQPVLNANQDLLKYRIVKREEARAGVTRIYRQDVTVDGGVPFYQIELPEKNVLEIVSIIVYNETGINKVPSYSEWNDDARRYYEVDFLPTNQIFVENDNFSQINGIEVGYWKDVPKRFEKEFLADGTCRVTFGGGDENYAAYTQYINALSGEDVCQDNSNLNIADILDNTALGNKIPQNCTIYVQYRVGGGQLSNVGASVLTEVANIEYVINGTNQQLNSATISSTKANNPIPAIGGKGLPSTEEIKYNIAANHAAQERCVTLNDYTSRAYQMPGKFGVPFRIHSRLNDNKVQMYILSIDGNGKLVANSTSRIKNNIVTYMSKYRMINDFIEINDAKIVNLQVNIDLYIDSNNFNSREIKTAAIDATKDFFNVDNWQMGQNIYISQLTDILRELPGVINVVNIDWYNLQGGGYSETLHAQATGVIENIVGTGGFRTKIEPIDNAILGSTLAMFEIRNPDKDIRVRIAG